MKTKIRRAAMIAFALMLASCANAGSNSTVSASATIGEINISGAWARPAIGVKPSGDHTTNHNTSDSGGMQMDGPTSAAYMLIENKGATADTLLSATADLAGVVEIHQSKEVNGMMMMEPQPNGLEIPANDKVELKPGGYHIMLMGLKQDLKPGSTIKLTLKFKSGAAASMDVPVRDVR